MQSPTSTTPDWSLRPAKPADRDYLLRLHELSYRPHVERVWGWDDAQQLEFFNRRFQPERLQIVEAGGESVGVLLVEEEEDALFLADVEITAEWQGRGIGSSNRPVAPSADASRGPATRVAGAHVNERARALYERLGFHEIWRDEIRTRMRWVPHSVLRGS